MGEYRAKKNNQEIQSENPQKTEKEEKQEATAKAVDVGATMYLDSMSGGMASKLKNVPGINGVWNKSVNRVSKVAAKTPIGGVAKKLNDSGVTDTVKSGYDTFQGAKSLNGASSTSKIGRGNKASESNLAQMGKSKLSTNGNGSGDDDLISKLMKSKKIPVALKIKIIIIGGAAFLFIILLAAILGYGKDYGNIQLTDGPAFGSSGSINNGSLQTLDNYVLNATGLTKLSSNLSKEDVEKLNEYINNSITSSSKGTGAGVAAAGQALVDGLAQWGYYLPYTWGGGHDNNKLIGASSAWGSTNTLDCSGFVSWAIRNGCNNSFASLTTIGLKALNGISKIDISGAKPGDLLLSDTHVVLVIKNDNGVLTCAEEQGKSTGLLFKQYTSPGKLDVYDMSGYYANNCTK